MIAPNVKLERPARRADYPNVSLGFQWTAALGWLLVSAGLGWGLRTLTLWPIEGFTYPFWLHAHSHVVLLGWAFNALFTLLIGSFIPKPQQRPYHRLWWAMQAAVTGMLIFFPIQGYALGSIIFSTMHVWLSYGMVWQFRQTLKTDTSLSARALRWALFFLVLSTLGPYSLGFLKAKHLEASPWYNLSIYFYLHFLYNGWLLFGCLALWLRFLEKAALPIRSRNANLWLTGLAVCTLVSYTLSTLWANPNGWVWGLASLSAVGQAVLAGIGGWWLMRCRHAIRIANGWTYRLLLLACAGLVVKVILQLISAIPAVVAWAYHERAFVIAYLHLVFIGVISLFLWAMAVQKGHFSIKGRATVVFLGAFILSEMVLVAEGLLSQVGHTFLPFRAELLWALTAVLWGSLSAIFVKQWQHLRQSIPPSYSHPLASDTGTTTV